MPTSGWVKFHQRAGIEEIASQGSTFPAFSDNFSGHRSGNLGKPSPNFLDTRGRLGVFEFPFDIFDVFDSQTGSVAGRVFEDTHEYVLMLLQVQRLQAAAHHSRTQRQLEWACDHCTAEAQAPEFEL
jgi:hypothetical protein